MSDNDSVETEQSDQYRKEEWRYQNLCLIIALSLSILSVVLFLLTDSLRFHGELCQSLFVHQTY